MGKGGDKVNNQLCRIPLFIMGLFFLYQGFYDIVHMDFLADSLRQIQRLPFFFKVFLLIFIPGLKLTLGLAFIFSLKLAKAAGFIAFVLLLIILINSIYAALTVKLCGTCGELKKHIVLFNAWLYVIINFIAFCINLLGFFICPDSEEEINSKDN